MPSCDLISLMRPLVRMFGRQVLRLVCVVVVGAVLSGCLAGPASTDPPDLDRLQGESAALAQVFSDIERVALTRYRNQDWCQLLEYDGGSFASTT